MRKSPLVFLLIVSVSVFSLNGFLFAEPPHPEGNPGANQSHRSGVPQHAMQNQGGFEQHTGPQHGMQQMGGMQGHPGGPGGGMEGSNMSNPNHAGDMNGGMHEDHFARADRNQDGHVGPQEAKGADQMHDMLDKNNDGKIGPMEHAWAESHNNDTGGQDSSNASSEYTSENSTSSSSYDESDSSTLSSSESSSSQERPLDANGDGMVDNVERRQAADRNQDGTVDDFEKNLAKEHFAQNQRQMESPMVQPAAFESGMGSSSSQGPSGLFSSGGGSSDQGFLARADRNYVGSLGPGEKCEAFAHHMEHMQNDRGGDQGFGNGQHEGMEGGPGRGSREHNGPQGGMQDQGHFGSQAGGGPGGMQGGPGGMHGGPGGLGGNQGPQHGGSPGGEGPQGGPGGGPRR